VGGACLPPTCRDCWPGPIARAPKGRGIYLASLDGAVNERLLGDDSNAVYAPSGSASGSASGSDRGYLLFGREGALMAQPFDEVRRQLTGEPFPVAGQVGTALDGAVNIRRRNFSVSDTGLLVFDPLPDRQRNQLVWVDRGGRKTGSLDGMDKVDLLRLSPDDQRFVVHRFERNTDLWLSNMTGGNVTRFTFDPRLDNAAQFPVAAKNRLGHLQTPPGVPL
jgi:hypothetical protein